MSEKPIILMREVPMRDAHRGYAWRQYFVITDARCAVVHMEPAVAGWNFGRVEVQGADDWGGMTAAEIFEWKMLFDDGITVRVEKADDDPLVVRLLQLASA